MLRLITIGSIIMFLAMFTGCRMCASYTDITGSPVGNGMSGDGYRAGSQYGGYSGGSYYIDGYQSTAGPHRVYDSEFSRSSSGTQSSATRTIQTPPSPSTYYVPGGNQVVPANYYVATPSASR